MVKNYQCIAKLFVISKVFDKVVTSKLINPIKSVISPKQHGFVNGNFITSSLLKFPPRAFDSKQDVVYTDLSKAVDKVSRDGLIFNLKRTSFRSGLVN